MPNCSYIHCQALIERPTKEQRCGPNLYFCNRDCYRSDCLIRYPGTSLANITATMYPEIVERLRREGKI